MRTLPLLLCLSALVCSCKKDSNDGASSNNGATVDDKAQVERICNGMNDLSLAYVAGVAELNLESLDDPADRDKAMTACKALSLQLAQCANRLALDDPICDAALNEHMGMTDTTPQGKGPAPRWSVSLPFEPYDLAVASDGRVAIAGETQVASVAEGTVKWTAPLDKASARVAWWKDCLLTGDGPRLHCYDDAGKSRWSVAIATDDTTWLSAIEAGPDAVTVITGAGAIVRVNADACATDPDGCATAQGTVESLGGMQVSLLPSGAIVGSDDDGITLASGTGQLLARRSAPYSAGVPGGALLVAGKSLLRASPGCTPDASDCWQEVTTQADLELTAPAELPELGVAFADTYGVIQMVGSASWKIDAGNDADLIGIGSTIYSVGHKLGLGDALEAPPRLRAIDARTGKTRWLTELGTKKAGFFSGYIVAPSDSDIMVATKTDLFCVPQKA